MKERVKKYNYNKETDFPEHVEVKPEIGQLDFLNIFE